jgi:hypothetical protein
MFSGFLKPLSLLSKLALSSSFWSNLVPLVAKLLNFLSKKKPLEGIEEKETPEIRPKDQMFSFSLWQQ